MTITEASALSPSRVRLVWSLNVGGASEFEIERTKVSGVSPLPFPGAPTPPLLTAKTSPLPDKGLEPSTTYEYKVRAKLGEGSFTAFSDPKTVTTPDFAPTFQAALAGASDNWEGYCLVVRIEAAALSKSGSEVRLTARRARQGGAHRPDLHLSTGAQGTSTTRPSCRRRTSRR